jgi:hypothetical protein
VVLTVLLSLLEPADVLHLFMTTPMWGRKRSQTSPYNLHCSLQIVLVVTRLTLPCEEV